MNATVGPYTLEDSLGMLPFGALTAATHAARSEPLAVLLLDERLARDTRFRGLLRLENARAGGLRHPALARVIEIGEASGALYLVVERPPACRALAQILDAGEPLTVEDAVSIVRQLAEALDAAHGRRLVHGAIDPSGVLLGEGGAVKLAGLGIMAAAEEAGLVDAVAERHESAYVAPEQGSGPRTVASADAYALGALATTLFQQRAGATAPTRAIAAVLDRQTDDDPSARYPTCAAFATALAEAVAASAAPASPESPAAPATLVPPAPPANQTASPSPEPTPARVVPPSSVPPPTAAPSLEASAPPPPPDPIVHALPWEPAASASGPASVAPSDAAPASPPSPSPVRASADAPPALPHAGEFEAWVRDLIDPPNQVAAARPADLPWDGPVADPADTPPLQQRPGSTTHAAASDAASADSTWAAAELDVTPAMLAVPKRLERRDPLGDAVRWATRSAPAADRLLDQTFAEGKLKRVPLGIVAAGVLVLLLLLVNQIVLGTAVIMLVVVLYGIPRVAGALTSGERQHREQALRVTGTASLQRRSLGLGWDRAELHLANGVTLGVPGGGYELLASYGRPLEVERPSVLAGGTEAVAVGYTLSSVGVTYLALSNLLLDVRDADGTVLFRHPHYDGEPHDALAAPPVARQPEVRWHRSTQGQTVQFPMPPAVRVALDGAKQSALLKAGLVGGVPLVLLLATLDTAFTGFLVVVTIGLFMTQGALLLERLLKLRAATESGMLTRVIGPVTLERYSTARRHRFQIRLENGAVLTVDAASYDALAKIGQLRLTDERPTDRHSSEERLTSVHEVASATVTYEPNGLMLLEIVDEAGQIRYRDPALGATEIVTPQPGAWEGSVD